MSSIFSFIILTINRGFKHRSCFISLCRLFPPLLCVSRTFAISFRFTAPRFSSFALRIHESPPNIYHNDLHLSILKLSIDTSSFFKETIPPPLSSILSTLVLRPSQGNCNKRASSRPKLSNPSSLFLVSGV